MKNFQPDYQNILDAATNKAAKRLPVYEHGIDPSKLEEIFNIKFTQYYNPADRKSMDEFFKLFNKAHMDLGYDTVSWECGVTGFVQGGQCLSGHIPGIIKSRDDFNKYPWAELVSRYKKETAVIFESFRANLPPGMKGVGGVGNGVFEVIQDFTGFLDLCMLKADDPELYKDLFYKVGDVMCEVWEHVLTNYKDAFCVCRMGDDLGYKISTMLHPDDVRSLVIPQYVKIVKKIHDHGKPFLLHSCGNIFDVFEQIITDVKIDAKHSNEDVIAPFSEWVNKYGDRIGNFGGVDMVFICQKSEQEIKEYVLDIIKMSQGHGGIAIGSGNSIPSYVPAKGLLAMVNTVREYRGEF